jgi:hypothetical protein
MNKRTIYLQVQLTPLRLYLFCLQWLHYEYRLNGVTSRAEERCAPLETKFSIGCLADQLSVVDWGVQHCQMSIHPSTGDPSWSLVTCPIVHFWTGHSGIRTSTFLHHCTRTSIHILLIQILRFKITSFFNWTDIILYRIYNFLWAFWITYLNEVFIKIYVHWKINFSFNLHRFRKTEKIWLS